MSASSPTVPFAGAASPSASEKPAFQVAEIDTIGGLQCTYDRWIRNLERLRRQESAADEIQTSFIPNMGSIMDYLDRQIRALFEATRDGVRYRSIWEPRIHTARDRIAIITKTIGQFGKDHNTQNEVIRCMAYLNAVLDLTEATLLANGVELEIPDGESVRTILEVVEA